MQSKLLVSLSALALSMSANATVLTFSGLGLSNFDEISQSYGDNVNALSDAVGSYLEGNAFTPDISVSHKSLNTDGGIVNAALEYWNNGYGDLTEVAFSGVNGSYAHLTLTAGTGYLVKLNSFDIAGWNVANRALDALQVLDAAGNVVWDSGVDTISGTGGTHDTFMPNIVGQELTIRWGKDWNIGVDNVNFDQVSDVPVPAAAWLFLSALVGLRAVKK